MSCIVYISRDLLGNKKGKKNYFFQTQKYDVFEKIL